METKKENLPTGILCRVMEKAFNGRGVGDNLVSECLYEAVMDGDFDALESYASHRALYDSSFNKEEFMKMIRRDRQDGNKNR